MLTFKIIIILPASQVTPGKKRIKHQKYLLDKVGWSECARCGQPKLPHRICRKNLDICAMREEDWKVEKLRREVEQARVTP